MGVEYEVVLYYGLPKTDKMSIIEGYEDYYFYSNEWLGEGDCVGIEIKTFNFDNFNIHLHEIDAILKYEKKYKKEILEFRDFIKQYFPHEISKVGYYITSHIH